MGSVPENNKSKAPFFASMNSAGEQNTVAIFTNLQKTAGVLEKKSCSLSESDLNIALVCSVSTETYKRTERKITDVSGFSPQPL